MYASQISIALLLSHRRDTDYVTIIIMTKARESRSRLYLNGAQVHVLSLSRSYVRIYDIAIPEKRDIEQTLVE